MGSGEGEGGHRSRGAEEEEAFAGCGDDPFLS